MSMTMTAVRVRSTVTFCGAQAIVTGIGAGAGGAMLTSLSVAHHAVCWPTPSCPPGCASSRFAVAVMEASAFRWSELFMAEADGKTLHLQTETVIAKTAL